MKKDFPFNKSRMLLLAFVIFLVALVCALPAMAEDGSVDSGSQGSTVSSNDSAPSGGSYGGSTDSGSGDSDSADGSSSDSSSDKDDAGSSDPDSGTNDSDSGGAEDSVSDNSDGSSVDGDTTESGNVEGGEPEGDGAEAGDADVPSFSDAPGEDESGQVGSEEPSPEENGEPQPTPGEETDEHGSDPDQTTPNEDTPADGGVDEDIPAEDGTSEPDLDQGTSEEPASGEPTEYDGSEETGDTTEGNEDEEEHLGGEEDQNLEEEEESQVEGACQEDLADGEEAEVENTITENLVDPYGTVYDAITKKAVAAARVILQQLLDGKYVDYDTYTCTDDGTYQFDLATGYYYQITATADDYLPYTWNFHQDDDTVHKIDFYLVLGSTGISSGWCSFDDEVTIVDDIYTNGKDIEIRAPRGKGHGAEKEDEEDPFKSITVSDGVTISTRKLEEGATDYLEGLSGGASGEIIMSAPSITIGEDAKLLAHVEKGSSYEAGRCYLRSYCKRRNGCFGFTRGQCGSS